MARKGLFDVPDPLIIKLKENLFQINQLKREFKTKVTKLISLLIVAIAFMTAMFIITFNATVNYWLAAIFVVLYGCVTTKSIHNMAIKTLILTHTRDIQNFIRKKQDSQTINNEELYNAISDTDKIYGRLDISYKIIKVSFMINFVFLGLIFAGTCIYYIISL